MLIIIRINEIVVLFIWLAKSYPFVYQLTKCRAENIWPFLLKMLASRELLIKMTSIFFLFICVFIENSDASKNICHNDGCQSNSIESMMRHYHADISLLQSLSKMTF